MKLTALLNKLNPVQYVQGLISPLARDGGDYITGSGIPADSSAIAKHSIHKLEIDFDAHIRQGPQVQQWTEGRETHFLVPTGTQDTDNGSSVDNAGRAAWSWTYSFLSEKGLDKFRPEIWIDKDSGPGVHFEEFYGKKSADGIGYDWYNEDTGQLAWSDDEGNGIVSQNSRNFAFNEILSAIDNYDYKDLGMNAISERLYEHADQRVDAGRGSLFDHLRVSAVDKAVAALNDAAPDAPYDFGAGEFDIVLRYENAFGLPVLENHAVIHVEDAII